MKNDDQMFQSVLSRRQEYREKKQKYLRIIRFTAPIAACGCLAVMLGIRFGGTIADLPDIPVQPSVTSTHEATESVPSITTHISTTAAKAKTTAVTKSSTAVTKTEAPSETEAPEIPEETEYYEPETEYYEPETEYIEPETTEYVPPEPQYGDENGTFVDNGNEGNGETDGNANCGTYDPYAYIELNGEIYTNTHTIRMGAPRTAGDRTPIYYPGRIDGLPYRYSGEGEIEVFLNDNWTVYRKE